MKTVEVQTTYERNQSGIINVGFNFPLHDCQVEINIYNDNIEYTETTTTEGEATNG